MAQLNTSDLLQTLNEDSLFLLNQIELISQHTPTELLETNDGEGRWNTLQVLEHLNSYYRYYIPLIEQKISTAKDNITPFFKPGWLGAKFTKMMLPKAGMVTNKMKAMKNHSPQLNLNADAVIKEFLQWQRKLIHVIKLSERVNLNSIRIPITLSKLIKLKLGDCFMFIVAHNKRHWIQIENLLGRFPITHSSDFAPGLPMQHAPIES